MLLSTLRPSTRHASKASLKPPEAKVRDSTFASFFLGSSKAESNNLARVFTTIGKGRAAKVSVKDMIDAEDDVS